MRKGGSQAEHVDLLSPDGDSQNVLMIDGEFFPMNNFKSAYQFLVQLFSGTWIRPSVQSPQYSSHQKFAIENWVEQNQLPADSQHSQGLVENLLEHRVRQMMRNGYKHHHVGGFRSDGHPSGIRKHSKAGRKDRKSTR